MRKWLYRLRGLLGLGALGGITGALIGTVWAVVEILVGGPSMFRLGLAATSTVWGVLGAATGVGFGLLLTATSGRQRLEEVTRRRAALLGGVATAAAPIILGTLIVGSLPPLSIALWIAGVGGSIGAGVGVGLLETAKRAQKRDKLEPTEPRALPR